MPLRRPRREELAAAILAPLIVGTLIAAWSWRDVPTVASKPAPRLDAAIPQDARIRSGRLANQLSYFILPNGYPEHRAELRLVVNAGSVLEEDDQRGLAHAVEHMVFRGTRRFPGHAIDDYLTSVGMRRGSDINASTNADETVYRITVPTDRLGVVDTALAILADMAHDATFDSTEAAQEAGVVMAEWRSRSSAAQRLRDERTNILLAESPYAGRPTIGDTAVLRRFDVGAMRRYYRDWYRPELMAVVAAGDFQSGDVERLIKKHFGAIPAARGGRTRADPTVPRATGSRAAIFRDPEAVGSRVGLWYPTRTIPRRVFGDHRTALIDALWHRILNERLEDAADKPGSPILGAEAETVPLVRSFTADVVSADVITHRERDALDLITAEVARLAQHGASASEVRRRAAALLREYREAEEWREHSNSLAERLIDQFLVGTVLVSRESAHELARDLLPTIHAADVLARARQVALDSGALVLMTTPRSADAREAPADLLTTARAASARTFAPGRDSVDRVVLVPTPPAPGKIASERPVADAKVFDWRLENGMRIILKPTRFAYDDIEFRMVGEGGASLADDADYPSAYRSDGVIASTGVGPLNGTRLSRRLDPTSLEVSATVRDDAVELSGSAAPRDIELLFQTVYLYFTEPRADTVAFRRYQERAASYVRGRAVDPDAVFGDSVAAIIAQRHPRMMRSISGATGAVSLSKALSFWKARMANASGFTLVMTGDFTLDRVRPLIARYLASLPAGTPEHARDVGIRFPRGVTRRQFVAGVAPRARTQIILSGAYDGTNETSDRLRTVEDLVEMALENVLRERLGGTYSANVYTGVSLVPPSRYMMTIDFESAPEQADSLTAAAIRELDRLRTRGPTDGETQRIREARTRDLDGELESNRYWASELSWHARMGWPLGTIERHQDDARLLTRATLHAACEMFLRTTEYAQVTMVPKTAVDR